MEKHATFGEMVESIYESFHKLQADGFYFELYFSKKAFKKGCITPKKAKANFTSVQVFYVIGDKKEKCLEKTSLLSFEQVFLMMQYLAEDKGLGEVLESVILAE